MDLATQLRRSGFNPLADVRMKDRDLALEFLKPYQLDFCPLFLLRNF